MKYYIQLPSINKAKEDIDEICRQEGYMNLARCDFGRSGVGRFFTRVFAVCNILFRMKKDDTLLLQYPMKKFYKMACRFARMKGARVVTIVHDLGAFRRKKLTAVQENKRLSLTDFLIVHNPTMRDYILEHGFKGGVHCLQIFDYLSEKQPASYKTPHNPWCVVYAGNLGRWRNEFLYKMKGCANNYVMDLYGNGFNNAENDCENLHYHGFMPSDEFVASVKADFGLVWDGDSLNECTGAWGEYLKINNPHKTSFYLCAGVPVIVWSKAAMAPFVKGENVGLVVDSLQQINERLAALTPDEYAKIREAAKAMGNRLADGYYFKESMRRADEYLAGKK